MKSNRLHCGFSFVVALFLTAAAHAEVPTFTTIDRRLPNPDRPYDMTTGTVQFWGAYGFGLYDLKFQPTNPEQLDAVAPNKDGSWEFDSSFDIAYEAQISFGLGPVHGAKGTGTARMHGLEVYSPASIDGQFIVLETELIELNLTGLSSDPAFLFRESPTLRSGGITMLENACPVCAGPFTIYRVSSYLDVFAEASADGGATWAPGDKSFRVVQQAEPVVLGDYNQNGVVDAADYVVWRSNLGPGGLANEAGISPGAVDQADYQFWRSRFGATVGIPISSMTAAAVPEPFASVLLTIAALASPVSRCRRRTTLGLTNERNLALSYIGCTCTRWRGRPGTHSSTAIVLRPEAFRQTCVRDSGRFVLCAQVGDDSTSLGRPTRLFVDAAC
jgi:hypothetical protein